MRKTTAVAVVATMLAAGSMGAANAAPDKTPTSRQLQAQVTALAKQVATLKALAQVPGPQGLPGRDGKDGQSISGPTGATGSSGAAGRNGVDGKDGGAGLAGAAGANGSGLPSGATILISGDCPAGMTVQGNAYQWRVYNGNPFTGSGSELWVSSCRVN
jgi:hypothetical protein